MATNVDVKLGDRSYCIQIGEAPEVTLPEDLKGRRALIISDSNVDARYGDGWEARLARDELRSVRAVVPAGEASKSLAQVGNLYSQALSAGLDRGSVIIALGGGVVGDLAGFVAATYLRGISFVQVPTSLLAMVDSAVGGKTGVNLEEGKNLVGAFHQPRLVVEDLETLRSLPEREYISGLAEVVKYGIIWDATLFEALEAAVESLKKRDLAALEPIVARCCAIKAEVIAVDERDLGVRAILNFGHTLGHAIENVSGYGAWLHGEAVAVGMAYAAMLSVDQCGFPEQDCVRVIRLLSRLGLPVSPDAVAVAEAWPALRKAMQTDKKARGGSLRFVLAERLGAVMFDRELDDEVLASAYEAMGPRVMDCTA